MKKHRKCKKIIAFVTVLFIAFVAVIGLHKTGIYRFDFLKDIYKKIDFQLSTNELNIPQDALSFSVYDIEQEEYLFYEGDSQLPTVASLAKLFAIDYALGKVDLEDIVEVNQEVLELVPAGSSLANLYAGEYTVKQIMEAMLVPSGNDAAYPALAAASYPFVDLPSGDTLRCKLFPADKFYKISLYFDGRIKYNEVND